MTDCLWNSSTYFTGVSESTNESSSSCLGMEESDSLSSLNHLIGLPQGTEFDPFANADKAFDLPDDSFDFVFEDLSADVATPVQTTADSLVCDSLPFPVASTNFCQDIPNSNNAEFAEVQSSTVLSNATENYELFPELLFDPDTLNEYNATFNRSPFTNYQPQVSAIDTCSSVEMSFGTSAQESFTVASTNATSRWNQDCKLLPESLNQASLVNDQSQSYPELPISTEGNRMSLPRCSLVSSPRNAFQSHNVEQKMLHQNSIIFPPSRNPASQNPFEGVCNVCGDKARWQHYGVLACEGCKGFFKRSVQKDATYVCAGNQNCLIEKKTRTQCSFCRYEKCLAAGMIKNVVQRDEFKRRKASNAKEVKNVLIAKGGHPQEH